MTAAALDFTYRYAFPSEVGQTERGFGLQLATCGAHHEQPHFFDGKLLAPREMGEMLLCLSEVVRTHFFLPRPPLMDPVVTSSDTTLRFEGFSGCCGVYARVDLPTEALACDHLSHGTTNVDFNNPMRAALARLRDNQDTRLAVGAEGVELSSGDKRVVEKKVKLPVRWIKGFSEVQLYQPSMQLKLETTGAEGRKFVRSLPRSAAPKRPSYVTRMGKGLRLSQRDSKDAVQFHGTHRVRVLEPLMNTAKSLRIWSDEETGTTAWEVLLRAGRFLLMLSPEVYRGFSGEGQALEKLAGNRWQDSLEPVQQRLHHQSRLDPTELAQEIGRPVQEVEAALAVLGARGLAGYDLNRGGYFHRQLPFDLAEVDALQPRLKAARKLLDENKVKIVAQAVSSTEQPSDQVELEVAGSGVNHLVRLREDDDRCTCPWFSKHQGQRGPCKHILAARMLTDDSENG